MARIYLLVDANEHDAARFAQLLCTVEPGCEVLCADSGPDALALLEERRVAPSLIFADFAMPGMNMVQFLAAVRSRPWLDGVRVAVLISSIADKDVVTCYRLGACTFVTRPANRHELREVVQEWARDSRAAELEFSHPLTDAFTRFRAA